MSPALHVERRDRLHHLGLLRQGQFGIDGNGEGFVGGPFRFREVPRLVTQVPEALLQMERNRIVDFRALDVPEFL